MGDRMSAEMKKMAGVVGSLDASKKERFLARLEGMGSLDYLLEAGKKLS